VGGNAATSARIEHALNTERIVGCAMSAAARTAGSAQPEPLHRIASAVGAHSALLLVRPLNNLEDDA